MTTTSPRRDLVLLSGGLDSATALAWRHHQGTAAGALTVYYGQRAAAPELTAVRRVASHYRVPAQVLEVAGLGPLLRSALTDLSTDVPDADRAQAPTVVPGRNALLVAAAAGIAEANGFTHVVVGMHAGDGPDYPDCRPEWLAAAAEVVALGSGGTVTLDSPFAGMPHAEVADLAGRLGVPVGFTWSCYRPGDRQCGRCGSCAARRAALAAAGVDDLTEYATSPVA